MLKWPDALNLAKQGNPEPDRKVVKTEAEWRKLLLAVLTTGIYEMFFAEPPSFDSLMADLRELEDRVNRRPRNDEGSSLPTPWQNRVIRMHPSLLPLLRWRIEPDRATHKQEVGRR
jgi:hypothetical protein